MPRLRPPFGSRLLTAAGLSVSIFGLTLWVLHAADPQQARPGERFESQRSRSLAMPLDPPDPESRAQENGEPENRAPASASQDSDLDHGDPRSIPEERAEEFAQASDEIRPPTSMALQLIPLSDVFAANPSHLDPDNSDLARAARRARTDLRDPRHSTIHSHRGDGKVFYVFFNTIESIPEEHEYVVQRIKKTERRWNDAGVVTETRTTYLVEVFKTRDEALKRPDMHYGLFHLRDHERFEVLKEFEIGTATIDDLAEDSEWPFSSRILYKLVHDYQEDRAVYDRVRFQESVPWTLLTSLDADGGYSVSSPEFDFDLPHQAPPEIRPEE